MAIRHWHPAKIAMLWVLDIALLIAIWKPCNTDYEDSITQCFYRRGNISIWLMLSLLSLSSRGDGQVLARPVPNKVT